MVKAWIEAMRLRTLPVSVAGVVTAVGLAVLALKNNVGLEVDVLNGAMCLCVAVLAQIASNFANEYYDYVGGLDKAGRVGPRRGVTEGDITPGAMVRATFVTLGLACCCGLVLAWSCGWWLILVGLLICVGVIAYSAGPYPLSHHGLGEVAVVFFFGIIPVNFTFYTMTGAWSPEVVAASLGVGLMGANVLIVNNYRDYFDDREVKKRTLAVILGRNNATRLYLINGFAAVALMVALWVSLPIWSWVVPFAYLNLHTLLYLRLQRLEGRSLNPILGKTSLLMFAYAVGLTVVGIIIG